MKRFFAAILILVVFSNCLAAGAIIVPAGLKKLIWTKAGGYPNQLSSKQSIEEMAALMPKGVGEEFEKQAKLDLANNGFKKIVVPDGYEFSAMLYGDRIIRGPVINNTGDQSAVGEDYDIGSYHLEYRIIDICGNHGYKLTETPAKPTPPPTKVPTTPPTPGPDPNQPTKVPTTPPTPGPDPNQPTKVPTTPPTPKPTQPGLVIGEKNYQGSCRKNELPPGNYSAMSPDEYEITNHVEVEGTPNPSVTPTPPIDPNCPPTAHPTASPTLPPPTHTAIPTQSTTPPPGGPELTVTPVPPQVTPSTAPTTQPVVVVTQIPVPTNSPVQGGQQPATTPIATPPIPKKIGGE